LSETKICNFIDAIADKNVGGFEITVDDIFFGEVFET
jgi:hypothetical protein